MGWGKFIVKLATIKTKGRRSSLDQANFTTPCGEGHASSSEEHEDLLDVTFDVLDLLAEHVEANSLGNWSALADGHDITSAETEGWRAVSGHSLMALLESVVLLDEVEVITTDDDGVLHLGGDHDTPTNSCYKFIT